MVKHLLPFIFGLVIVFLLDLIPIFLQHLEQFFGFLGTTSTALVLELDHELLERHTVELKGSFFNIIKIYSESLPI